ncbi:ATP-dependent helicase YprA (DUF1998 family) [Paraburkholderia sp. EB58]|uniref:DEAD/DEAH box helicase n=1 Tax=Paraburkholderia sp. EB58 TaxID=3035125 RepID=UPI003D1EBE7D
MAESIQQTIEQLHASLRDYIEATYHISHPALIAQRRDLLERPGVIHQIPYLESTPRYQSGKRFESIPGLSKGAVEVLTALSENQGSHPQVLHNPPYIHQSEALRLSQVEGKNLVIMTGTGSGKTESFLMPILGKFAKEATERPGSFGGQPAMRAMILYPMNALVNDQLGRLRSIFGDARVVSRFNEWCGRPPRFARYTSRTPYAGVRTAKRDQTKFKSFEAFFVETERLANEEPSHEQARAAQLRAELKAKGKWPAKPDLTEWFGDKGSRWAGKDGEFKRAVTLPADSELITRHEVQAAPPDLLVTNYSMLEYMLMRPIERTIFDRTSDWLKANPTEKFLVVLDEAHLYRGAAGAEVGLLLRRLRDRFDIDADRFQVICATASFSDEKYAPSFGAQLSGVSEETFVPITGHLKLAEASEVGTKADAAALATVSLADYYSSDSVTRINSVKEFLSYREVEPTEDLDSDLYRALKDFNPLGRLINTTMREAHAVAELGELLFPGVQTQHTESALTALMSLGSVAREHHDGNALLPCRIHNFYRGLPGLWACINPACTELTSETHRSAVCGRIYSQPRQRCGCGSQVLELFTCRNCGSAYGRAYSDSVEEPDALWNDPGKRLRMESSEVSPLNPLDLLLEEPKQFDKVEPASYDLDTGRLNSHVQSDRVRQVFIRKDRLQPASNEEGEQDARLEARGLFVPCGVCGTSAAFARTSVQDHQTKGDQPFQSLVSKQIQIQPPSTKPATSFAPLRGRKVLVFSDSRQVAARLAPNLQMYSTRDSLRPLLIWGFRKLQSFPAVRAKLSLEDAYLSVLLAANVMGVRLRPELSAGESMAVQSQVDKAIREHDALNDVVAMQSLWIDVRVESPPVALLDDIYKSITDRHLGLAALALASIAVREDRRTVANSLPTIPGVAENAEDKITLIEAWLRCWHRRGFWLNAMPAAWWLRSRSSGTSVLSQKSKFKAMDKVLPEPASRKLFETKWLPVLQSEFTSDQGGGARRLEGKTLTLRLDGAWVRCNACKSVHRPVTTLHHCLDCGSTDVLPLLPDSDLVFNARKGYYRSPVQAAFAQPPVYPTALIAAEHTAQLNAPQSEDVFSKAEENELLFQDVQLSLPGQETSNTAIDVLSSTTTMEVGIDIGALSGVALRNMPPARSNYQQRAGRAGRRGNAVATVIAFGSADSHDEHYFSNAKEMIRGPVIDPVLTLDNPELTRRHLRAYLLQAYHRDRIPQFDDQSPSNLFSVLGSVAGFRSENGRLNRTDFETWLVTNQDALRARIKKWLPTELAPDDADSLLDGMISDCLSAVDEALSTDGDESVRAADVGGEEDDPATEPEVAPEVDEDSPPRIDASDKLLDRLLYCGVLPRYAFPTDVATFSVFDRSRSTSFRHVMKFAPSQSLPIALSQYAPDKQVWISGKCYTSGAIYSPIISERFDAFRKRKLYRECNRCGFADTKPIGAGVELKAVADCPACGGHDTFGPARYWLRPPGFAHPNYEQEVTSPDDMPQTSYATRAKLTMVTPADGDAWGRVNGRIRVMASRQHLLVSNTGPEKQGYTHCVACGCIEATTTPEPKLFMPHVKPYPDDDSTCPGDYAYRNLVLGTDFISDVALFSLRVDHPLILKPGTYPTGVALRTVSEALAKAACQLLDIEPGEVMAEFRPALTMDSAGRDGLQAEIFLYDTLPGGAGFSTQAARLGDALFRKALLLLKSCPEQCDASCYRCLRSFKNKVEHHLLDRHVGVELIEYLLTGILPAFDVTRATRAQGLLISDLERQSADGQSIERDVCIHLSDGRAVVVPIVLTVSEGAALAVCISAPLMDDNLSDENVQEELQEQFDYGVVVVNELLIRENLPAASAIVWSAAQR